MMWHKTNTIALLTMLCGWGSPTFAVQPEVIATTPKLDIVHVTELGENVADIDLFRDNYYQYEARVEELTATALKMEGGTIEVLLTVLRVTPGEVLVEVSPAGKTRLLLKHATPPFFGNLGTVWYCAQPSAEYWNMLAKPVGLRIGDEISLEMAKQVRKRDTLRVVGRVESMPIRMKSVFEPRVAAVIVDWKVVEMILDQRESRLRY